MSGLDPLAAFAAQIVANAQAAIEEAALDLGAATKALQAQISVGDILTATVLPPENGSDRLDLFGQIVAARIPPGIAPGEQLQLQVTGFTSAAIVVRNLGVVDPENPPPAPNVQLPPTAPGAPQSAILRSGPPAASPSPQAVPASPNATPPQRAPFAPPREIFVAASVVSANPPEPSPEAPPSAPAPPAAAPPAAAAPGEVEARIVLGRAAPAPPRPAENAAPIAPRVAAPAPVRASAPNAPPPPIAARASAPPAAAPAPAPGSAPSARALATPEAQLLARVRVPVTATTLAAARAASGAARSLTTAFERLDAALANLAPDPRVGTARALLSFVGRFDLRSTAALPEQIAAFVARVVDGAEGTLAQLVRTVSAAPASSPNEPLSAPAPAAPLASTAAAPEASPPHAASVSPSVAPPAAPNAAAGVNAAAQAAERAAAMAHDVKSALIALAQNPPRDASPAVLQAVRDALVATTAVQVNVLNAQANDPSAVTIPLPAYFFEGGKPAQLRISRDAPGGKQRLDADNFHIAFVLDTKRLGTVAIDVQTVGRAVSVDVKTQTTHFADRFRATLGDLRGRLETLRYRVAAIGAGAAPAGQTAHVPPAFERVAESDEADASTLDMRA